MHDQLTLPGFVAPPARATDDLAAYLTSRANLWGPRTLILYRHVLGRFERWRDGRPISAMLCEGYLATLRHRAEDTQRTAYRTIKTYVRWLHARGRCDVDPFAGVAGVAPPKHTRKRRRTYTEAEVVALLLASGPSHGARQRWAPDGPRGREQPQARALILLLIDTALRAEEVCRLTCRQARADALIVVGKGGHEDRAHLTAPTHALLRELAEGRADDAPLFRSWTGGPCTGAALRGIVQRLASRAGVELPPRPIHAFRHYAAQGWARAKLPDLVIKRLMRHANLETTKIYTDGARDEEIAELHRQVSPIGRLLAAAEGKV